MCGFEWHLLSSLLKCCNRSHCDALEKCVSAVSVWRNKWSPFEQGYAARQECSYKHNVPWHISHLDQLFCFTMVVFTVTCFNLNTGDFGVYNIVFRSLKCGSVILQAGGASKSWNRKYPQSQSRAPSLSALCVYIQQTFSHAFLPEKGKYALHFTFGLLSLSSSRWIELVSFSHINVI